MAPPTQYSKDLTVGFPVGSVLKVTGTVNDDAGSFTVKLLCKQEELFSLRADFTTHKVELNSALKLEGKKDEAKTITNPFEKGKPFELKIFAEPKKFQIKVIIEEKNVEIRDFEYRTDLGSLTKVEVAGDLIIEPVEMQYSKDLRDRFPEGSFLKVTGLVNDDAGSFTVKLLCKDEEFFSLRADFKTHKVELSSALKLEGKKVAKTITNPFPFKRSQSFELIIFAEPKKFKIKVVDLDLKLDVEIDDFEYRTDLGSIIKVEVAGDLIIKSVEMPKPKS